MNIEDLIKKYGLEYLISDSCDIEYLELAADKIWVKDFSFFNQIDREIEVFASTADSKEINDLLYRYNKYIQVLSKKVNTYCESLLNGGVLWSSAEAERDNKRLIADFYLHIGEIGEIYEKLTYIELNISERQLQAEESFGTLAELDKKLMLLTLLFDIFKLDKKEIEEKKAKLVHIKEKIELQNTERQNFFNAASINRREIGEYILKTDNASRGNKDNQMNKDEIIQSGLKLIKSLVQCKT